MAAEKSVTLESLTSFHREKVLNRAREYRKINHKKILELMSAERFPYQHPCAPTGSTIFYPEKWTASHWEWFREVLLQELWIKMRNP